MSIKGIIFDLDGTILNTSYDLAASANHALRCGNLPEVSIETVISCTGNGTKKLMERLTEKKSKVEQEKLFEIFEKYYNEHPFDEAEPYDNVKETLEELKRRGYKLCVLSNKDDNLVQEIVPHFYPGLFDFITGARKNFPLKPDPALVNLCADKVGLKIDEVIFVGDTKVDYQTALNCSINSYILTTGFQSEEKLVEAGVKNLINNIKELLKYL